MGLPRYALHWPKYEIVAQEILRKCANGCAVGHSISHSPASAPRATERRGLRAWQWLLPFAGLALLLRLPSLLPAEAQEAAQDDPAIMADAHINPIDQRGGGFPGSAYFYAEDAFGFARPNAAADLPQEWKGNRHILPIDIGAAAPAYRFAGRTSMDRVRALSCLANAIYYEAGNEPEEGQRAVAQVVLNRLRHAEWPNSVCGVVYQGTERSDLGCQFTFSCDGAMARLPERTRWLRGYRIAEEALDGKVFAPAGLSTFYHTLAVRPGWSSRLTPVAIIGAHIFYRMPGNEPAHFRDAYAGAEPTSGPSIYAYTKPAKVLAAALEGAGPPLPEFVPLVAIPSAGTGASALTSPAVRPRADEVSAPTNLPSQGRTNLPDTPQIRPEYQSSGRVLN
jgi:spore germination cell wall hydrolase CwlJ-like protein